MACQCGCATETPSPDSEARPVAEGEGPERDLERVVQELESRVKKLEAERAAA